MDAMFNGASAFNQDAGATGGSTRSRDMSWMFYKASSFNQPLGRWQIEKGCNTGGMFSNTKFDGWHHGRAERARCRAAFLLAFAFAQSSTISAADAGRQRRPSSVPFCSQLEGPVPRRAVGDGRVLRQTRPLLVCVCVNCREERRCAARRAVAMASLQKNCRRTRYC